MIFKVRGAPGLRLVRTEFRLFGNIPVLPLFVGVPRCIYSSSKIFTTSPLGGDARLVWQQTGFTSSALVAVIFLKKIIQTR